jgi:integrase
MVDRKMANIRKRGDRWQVQVRRAGLKPISRTFAYHKDAEAWARDQERRCDMGLHPVGPEIRADITVRDLLERYMAEITPRKKSANNEKIIIRALLRAEFCDELASIAKPMVFARYRDKRLKLVMSTTIRRELCILSHTFDLARKEWGYSSLENPLKDVRCALDSKPRDRRLERGEFEQLQQRASQSRATYLWPLIRLAVETGMRRGELLSLTWDDVDVDARLARLYDTKNGENRTVPLTLEAVSVLQGIPQTSTRVFPVSPVAVRQAWVRLVRRAGIENLRFHDLRHEAISRFFEKGLSVPEVALISGHKTPSQLFRYTQMTPEHVLTKLD